MDEKLLRLRHNLAIIEADKKNPVQAILTSIIRYAIEEAAKVKP
jgi:hypothetical protein